MNTLNTFSTDCTVKSLAGLVFKLRDIGAKRGDFVAGWAGQKRFISVVYLGIHHGVVFYVPHMESVKKAFSLEDFDPQVVLSSFNVDEPVIS